MDPTDDAVMPGRASRHRGTFIQRGAVVWLSLLLCAAMTGCAWGPDKNPAGIHKAGDEEVRTQLQPLIALLPELADATSAQWMGGTLGGRLPVGPSVYWWDAVVVLDDATLTEVVALPDLLSGEAPEVSRKLRGSLPGGELLQGEALNEFFSEPPWSVDAWLAPEDSQIVLLIEGGHN